jgi:hypothetical protein
MSAAARETVSAADAADARELPRDPSRDAPVESVHIFAPQFAHSAWWLLLVLALGTVYEYLSLFGLSGIPYFRTGDESVFWTYAYRMLSGQVFLRDFHQFSPPGTDLIYAAAFRLFGVSLFTTNWLVLALGLAIAVCVFCCARFFLRPSLAALSALCVVVMVYGDRLDATHHWFSSLANLAAVLTLLPHRTFQRVAAAGVLFGIASFFTQTRGAAGLIACCAVFLWERRRGAITTRTLSLRISLLVGVTFLVWLALSWRFIAQAGLATYWHAQVTYLPKDTIFPSGFLVPAFGFQLHPNAIGNLINRLAMYLMLLLACPLVAFQCLRGQQEDSRDPVALFLLASLGIVQALEVITVLNWNRMAAAEIPAAILTVYLIARKQRQASLLVPACWALLAVIGFGRCLPQAMHRYTRVDLPTGPALAPKNDAEELNWLATHTRPGDTFFDASNARLYALLELRNAMPVDMLTTVQNTLPSWLKLAIQGLDQSRTRYILWSERAGIGSVERMHTDANDHLDPMRLYMQHSYICIKTFADGDQVWERRDLPQPGSIAANP